MNRILLAFLGALTLLASFSIRAEETPPPNFVVVFVDDLGYADLGCFGSPDIKTPRLDALAKEGMRFTHFYAQHICGPSRAALMTGSHPLRVAEPGNIKEVHPILHDKEITVAEVLKTKGYATGCFGKWDLARHNQKNFIPELMPNGQGFDYFYGTPSSNDSFVDIYRNETLIKEKADMGMLTKTHTDEAIQFIEKHRDQPFFAYIPYSMVHTRLDASADFKGKSPRGLYGDCVEEIDYSCGRILDVLKKHDLVDNTYFLFTSDNGPWLIKNKGKVDGHRPADHGGSAGPLRSGKVSTWEGGVRVPTILWAPGRVPAGTTCDKIAATLDVLPTFAALAGAEAPTDRVLDGIDIRHLFRGDFDEAEEDRVFRYYFINTLQAVRQGKWKLHLPRPANPPWLGNFARNAHIAPEDWAEIKEPFLVDLDADPGETKSVAADHPELVKKLLQLAEEARADIGDYNRVGENMRFFDPMETKLTKPVFSNLVREPKKKKAPAPKPKAAPAQQKTSVNKAQGAKPQATSETKPNIIVIMADDLGYADLGCYGCKDIPTPHIDSLAADGIRFTSAYVTWPMCGPSRAGFLTGRHQSTFGYYKNQTTPLDPKQGLPKMDTIGSLLQQQGYVTGGVGKWHMGTTDEQHPNAMGFDDWFGFLSGGLMYFPLDHPNYRGRFTDMKRPVRWRDIHHTLPVIHNREPVEWDQYLTRELTDAGLHFLDKNQTKPFFLFMSYNAPHLDLEAPAETIAKFSADKMTQVPGVKPMSRAIYAAMMDEMDRGVGQLLAKLEALSLADNTMVWFLSDNGGMARTSDNRPLRGAKGIAFEGGLRVPMLVRWPGKAPAGLVLEAPVTSLDIGATAVAMAGGDPAASGLHGKDIRPYITQASKEAPHEFLVWHTGRTQSSVGVIREGDFKLMINGAKARSKPKLYNLAEDLGETTDVAAAHPERVQRMLARWTQWNEGNAPDLWKTPENNAYQYAPFDWLKGSPYYMNTKAP